MLGGIPWAGESDQSGVYSIATDSDIIINGTNDVRTIVYIGGQFALTDTNYVPTVTNRNLVVYENSASRGQRYVPVTLGNGSSGLSGVGTYIFDCTSQSWINYENGVFVNTIVVAPSNGTNDVLIGGNFEPSQGFTGGGCYPVGSPPTAGYQGLAKITKQTTAHYFNIHRAVSWSTLDYCDNTCNNCVGNANIVALSYYVGVNRFLAGTFTKWPPFCASTVTSGAGRFGEGSAAGAEMFVSAEAFDINGSASQIFTISQGSGANYPIYVGGSFYKLDGVISPYIIKFNP
jgi:hypothetical protein